MWRVLLLLLFVAGVRSHSCLPCDRSRCVAPRDCVGGVVLDVCSCCKVCSRQQNESCGGLHGTKGKCDVGMKCVIQPQHGDFINGHEEGICKLIDDISSSETCRKVTFDGCNAVDEECRCSRQRACANPFQFPNKMRCAMYVVAIEESKNDCSNFKCRVRYTPNCASDSELIDSVWPAGECCPLPSTCECRKDRCKQTLCRRGYDRVLVRRATGKPGGCCDRYQCKPTENECSDVTCPPVDRNVTCPEDSVKDTQRTTKDGCCSLPPKCRCKSGICPETKCSDGYRPIVSVRGTGRPGTCCDVIQCVRATPQGACLVNGAIYKHGEEYQPEPCKTCRCSDGINHCSREQCRVLECERQYTQEGSCCPKCRIIMLEPPTTIRPLRICMEDSGKSHLPGEVWFQDPCTRCVCKENGPKCIASSCQKNCENPRPVAGECCGVCDEPTYMTIPSSKSCPSMRRCNLTGVQCPFGFKSDDLGCRLCECRRKTEVCQSMTSCKLNCPRGFVVNGVGCEICQCKRSKTCRSMASCGKRCPFGFRTDKGGCDRCRCRRCDDVIASCHKECKFGRVVNKFGCEICMCRSDRILDPSAPVHSRLCEDEGTKRDDGEGWKTASGRQCVCRHGTILCDVVECPVPHCDHPIVKKGSFCATCSDSPLFKSEQLICGNRVEGETWNPDGCTSCACNSGRVMCTYETCKPAPCAKPVFSEGYCCPTCSDLPDEITTDRSTCFSSDGTPHGPGAVWKQDKCTSCKCENGVTRCFGEKCQQFHDCPNPVVKRDQCCPKCLGEENDMNLCYLGDRNYTHGEVWSMRPDACSSCSCVHGNIFCRKEICRPLPNKCELAVRPPGQCCDKCEAVVDDSSERKEDEPGTILMPIIAGVGAFVVLLLLAAVIAFLIFKKRAKGPKAIYQQGRIVRKQPAVAT